MTYPELKTTKRNCWTYDYEKWMKKPNKERLDICETCWRKGCTWWWDTIEEPSLEETEDERSTEETRR